MAIYEQDVVMFETKENGDKEIKMPISRVNNIEGIGRSANTAYVVGDVVYVDNNKKVALKCTQAGTTSNSELSVSTANIGNVITDGTVKWQVCNRTSDVTSVNGKTGDVVVGEIKDLSISGKTITVTFADNSTKTLTTQDTGVTPARYITAKHSSGTNWYEVYNDGWVRQGGIITPSAKGLATVTLHKRMANTNYVPQISQMYPNNWVNESSINNSNKTVNSFQIFTNYTYGTTWSVEGQGA